jgi:hypothetical protein
MNQYALALGLASGFLAFPQSPTIKVRIDDLPNASAGTLRKAEKEAGALLESGGIKVIWRGCSKAGGCEHQLAADELILHLRPPSREANQEELSRMPSVAPPRTPLVPVFLDGSIMTWHK